MTEHPPETALPVPAVSSDIAAYRSYYDPELDFAKLAHEVKQGYIARGFRLLPDKDALVGVPFIIVALTYREGIMSPDRSVQGDYISCEAVVGDQAAFSLPQVKAMLPGDLQVYANEPVVFNDGSTGVRRAITKLLHDTGMIDVGGDYTADGDFIYDRPFSQWERGADIAQSGITADADGEPFRYFAIRGLRRSDYVNPFGNGKEMSVTFYFA